MLAHVPKLKNRCLPKEHLLCASPNLASRFSLEGEKTDQLHLVIPATRHTIGEKILVDVRVLEDRIRLIVFQQQLVEASLDMAKRAIHYRDLNTGNMVAAKHNRSELCPIDFDRARRRLDARGDSSNRIDPFQRAFVTAVDDAQSANMYSASTAYHGLLRTKGFAGWVTTYGKGSRLSGKNFRLSNIGTSMISNQLYIIKYSKYVDLSQFSFL